jgi:uncharacterized protein (DUF305 family)
MTQVVARMIRSGSAVVAVALATACVSKQAPATPAAQAPSGSETKRAYEYTPPPKPPANEADVHFMTGMIPHHAQAVKIAGWCGTHGARADLKILCERIVVGQRDEIKLMQTWLSDHGLEVPAADATHMKMKMGGMEHDMLMPGMLSDEQLAALNKARGAEFDKLFLTAMIAHHEGAIKMVQDLFSSKGAGQDEVVFRFATDVEADQTTEIAVMKEMLGGGL